MSWTEQRGLKSNEQAVNLDQALPVKNTQVLNTKKQK